MNFDKLPTTIISEIVHTYESDNYKRFITLSLTLPPEQLKDYIEVNSDTIKKSILSRNKYLYKGFLDSQKKTAVISGSYALYLYLKDNCENPPQWKPNNVNIFVNVPTGRYNFISACKEVLFEFYSLTKDGFVIDNLNDSFRYGEYERIEFTIKHEILLHNEPLNIQIIPVLGDNPLHCYKNCGLDICKVFTVFDYDKTAKDYGTVTVKSETVSIEDNIAVVMNQIPYYVADKYTERGFTIADPAELIISEKKWNKIQKKYGFRCANEKLKHILMDTKNPQKDIYKNPDSYDQGFINHLLHVRNSIDDIINDKFKNTDRTLIDNVISNINLDKYENIPIEDLYTEPTSGDEYESE